MDGKSEFKKEVDVLWDFAVEQDPELLDGMQWCEKEAQRKGMSMDNFIYMILARHNNALAIVKELEATGT